MGSVSPQPPPPSCNLSSPPKSPKILLYPSSSVGETVGWKRMVLAGLEELAALCLPNSAILEQPHLQPAQAALASHRLSGLKPLHPLPCPPKAVVSQPDSAWRHQAPGKDGNSLPWLSQHWLNNGMSPCSPPLCCCHCEGWRYFPPAAWSMGNQIAEPCPQSQPGAGGGRAWHHKGQPLVCAWITQYWKRLPSLGKTELRKGRIRSWSR